MAKSCNQKAKILYLERMLSGTTGENPISNAGDFGKIRRTGYPRRAKEYLRRYGDFT